MICTLTIADCAVAKLSTKGSFLTAERTCQTANQQRLSGADDWCLPTLSHLSALASLYLEGKEGNPDSEFLCWTSTEERELFVHVVNFGGGKNNSLSRKSELNHILLLRKSELSKLDRVLTKNLE